MKELMRKVDQIKIFFQNAAEQGIFLLGAAIAGIMIANSRWGDGYESFFAMPVGINVGRYLLSLPVRDWINDCLMVLFFFVVGMEIKRELVNGYLSTNKQRILPVVAASSGALFPVLIYCLFNYKDSGLLKGWAIPAATDIAFAIGMLALFGKKLPISLRVFLTALAIIDDLIAICIIAVFYTDSLNFEYLLSASFIAMFLYIYGKSRFYNIKLNLAIGVVLWFCVLNSGVHATISGVILGVLVPIVHPVQNNKSPLLVLEKLIHPINAYFILPLFAFANCGLKLMGISLEALLHPVTMGIAVGLFLGKQIGVMFAVAMLKCCRMLVMPVGANIIQLYGVSLLCGIGFTMSLFIAIMSFDATTGLLNQAQLGVFVGSMISALTAALMLKIARKR